LTFNRRPPRYRLLRSGPIASLFMSAISLWASGRLRVYIFNARVFHRADMEAYFHAFRARDPFYFIVHRLRQYSVQTFETSSARKRAFDYGKRASFFIKKLYEVRPELAS
jgi:hypothetical protein